MRNHGIDFVPVQKQTPLQAEQAVAPDQHHTDDYQHSLTEEQSYSTPGSDHKPSR